MTKQNKVMKGSEGNLLNVKLATAEKVLRDIARRNGEVIRKRRSQALKEQHGAGYGIIDANTSGLLSGGMTQDGCDMALEDVAEWYKGDERNTPWQNVVIKSILAGKIE